MKARNLARNAFWVFAAIVTLLSLLCPQQAIWFVLDWLTGLGQPWRL